MNLLNYLLNHLDFSARHYKIKREPKRMLIKTDNGILDVWTIGGEQ